MENEIFEEIMQDNQEISESTEVSNMVSDSTEQSSDSNIDIDNGTGGNTYVENEVNDSFEELLKEFIKQSIEDDSLDHEKTEGETEVLEGSEETEDIIDYTEILNSISDKSNDIYDSNSMLLNTTLSEIDNNTLNSDIEDISLTNFLLLVLFIAILFTAVMNFAGGFFK